MGLSQVERALEWRILRTRAVEVSLWEAMLPPEVLRLPEELARVDALLDDPVFFVPFFDARVDRRQRCHRMCPTRPTRPPRTPPTQPGSTVAIGRFGMSLTADALLCMENVACEGHIRPTRGASAGCEFLTAQSWSLKCSMIRIWCRARSWHRWSRWPSGVAWRSWSLARSPCRPRAEVNAHLEVPAMVARMSRVS